MSKCRPLCATGLSLASSRRLLLFAMSISFYVFRYFQTQSMNVGFFTYTTAYYLLGIFMMIYHSPQRGTSSQGGEEFLDGGFSKKKRAWVWWVCACIYPWNRGDMNHQAGGWSHCLRKEVWMQSVVVGKVLRAGGRERPLGLGGDLAVATWRGHCLWTCTWDQVLGLEQDIYAYEAYCELLCTLMEAPYVEQRLKWTNSQ